MSQNLLRIINGQMGLSARFIGYKPQFHVEEFAPQHFWVRDGETRVALVVSDELVAELVNFDPCEPKTVEFPAVYHAPTQPGERVTLIHWGSGEEPFEGTLESLEWEVTPSSVSIFTRQKWRNGRFGSKRTTFCVDADFGYSIRCIDEMQTLEPEPRDRLVEFCNFLPRGITDDRPESGRRFPFVLWQHPSGEILHWNQNNISARSLGAMDALGQRCIAQDGFFGFFGDEKEERVGVAMEFIEAMPGITATTCPNLLDEHLLWTLADANQGALYRAVYNLVALDARIGEYLATQAQPIDFVTDRYDPKGEEWNKERVGDYPRRAGKPYDLSFYPLSMGQIADFETPVELESSFWGQVFPYLQDSNDAISVVSNCAFRGHRSLRVRVENEELCAYAHGGSLHVTQGQRYRLSAMVKTSLREGEATICALEYLFGRGNVTGRHLAPPLAGERDWTRLEVEFTPGDNAHVVDVRFEVSGDGQAWIDEILLEKLD